MMALLFALTIFAAAAVLFLLEPMMGKILLPSFGGAPAVWNLCVAFFQAVLLAAYGYAHWLTRLGSVRAQMAIHLAVVALPWLVLPIAAESGFASESGGNPTWSVLAVLLLTAGLPFFVVATTSPLLGQWFAASRHRHAADPYYLYAASNAGSMLGLLAYPTLVEPRLALPGQTRGWAASYAALLCLIVTCMVAVWRRQVSGPARERGKSPSLANASDYNAERPSSFGISLGDAATGKPSWLLKLMWLALAFVPSSLLLGVTAHLSSDVSPVPLIWVVPLALYLLSFVLVFSRLPAWVHCVFALALPLLVLAQVYHMYTGHAGQHYPMQRFAALHLATFFSAAMVCHGALARRRPAAALLTQFYFCMALGGVLGGMFNALAAPFLFRSLLEYPLALSAACLFSPLALWRWPKGRGWLDLPIAAIVGLLCAVVLFTQYDTASAGPIAACLLLCCLTVGRPICFASSAAALFIVVGCYDDVVDHVLYRERDFYGVLQVQTDADEEYYYLSHGRIRHGQQRRSDDPAIRNVPLIYYYPTGPIGQVFESPIPTLRSKPPVAVIGLGVGSLAYYGAAGQEFVFYEIDPAVERIARDDDYFTFLRDSRAEVRVLLGDARLSLGGAAAGHYGLIVVDAFSGDAIPVHLLTHEAMQLYLKKLAPRGVLAFHISNQFLDLAPVLGNLASASHLVGLDQNEAWISDEEQAAGKSASHWVVLAKAEADFGGLVDDARWRPLAGAPELPLWTDHYTSLWGIAHWRE
jgi:hypothetical protein